MKSLRRIGNSTAARTARRCDPSPWKWCGSVSTDSPAAPGLEYRSPHARYAILTLRRGRWGAELLALDYDWDAAARRASENGRPDWAAALATGAAG